MGGTKKVCGGEEMGNATAAAQHGKDQNELRPVPSINPLNPLILLTFFFFLLSTPS